MSSMRQRLMILLVLGLKKEKKLASDNCNKSKATIFVILIIGLTAGHRIFIWVTSVSPVTATLCASDPFPP